MEDLQWGKYINNNLFSNWTTIDYKNIKISNEKDVIITNGNKK